MALQSVHRHPTDICKQVQSHSEAVESLECRSRLHPPSLQLCWSVPAWLPIHQKLGGDGAGGAVTSCLSMVNRADEPAYQFSEGGMHRSICHLCATNGVSQSMTGATHGVTVSTSAFLACHQCYCAGSSLAWGLNTSGFSVWHFPKLVTRGFLQVLLFLPLLHRLMVQPIQ